MTETIYLGTYTKRTSQGIYKVQLDLENKRLENVTLVAEANTPTYIAVSQDESVIYSVTKGDNGGGLATFMKNEDGEFGGVDTVLEDGAPPCYVAFDRTRNFVYTANYHKGEVSVFKSDENGKLLLLDTAQHTGSSTHENQQSAHAHYFNVVPTGEYLVACDLGTDEVYTYSVDEAGKLTEVSRFKAEPGTGPRHLVFHPNNQYAYLFGELSSEVLVLSYDASSGSFEHQQTLSTIPEDHTDFNGGAAIRISPDGRFVYASNRGHDSLAVFAVSEDGRQLERIQLISTEGSIPRDFNLDHSGQFVVVGHQESDNLTLFERDNETGKLTLLQKDVHAPEVVCVAFA